MNRYKFVIEFESKDRITEKQLDDLEYTLFAQIAEPHEDDEHYGWSSADYETGEIHITREGNGGDIVTGTNRKETTT